MLQPVLCFLLSGTYVARDDPYWADVLSLRWSGADQLKEKAGGLGSGSFTGFVAGGTSQGCPCLGSLHIMGERPVPPIMVATDHIACGYLNLDSN